MSTVSDFTAALQNLLTELWSKLDALGSNPSTAPSPSPVPAPTPTPIPVPTTTPSLGFYVRHTQAADHNHAKLASVAQAMWINGTGDIDSAKQIAQAAKQANEVATFVVYNIPNRDNGGQSSGGAADNASYQAFIDQVATAVTGCTSIITLEPDAILLNNGVPPGRLDCLKYAITKLKGAGASVMLDIGHPHWAYYLDAIAKLKEAGIDQADGFTLNTSNFQPYELCLQYGEQISAGVNKPYVVDTSRAGNAAMNTYDWCNVPGAQLGPLPQMHPTTGNCYAYVWNKPPGESDGNCNGGPAAGQWFDAYATALEQATKGWLS